MLYGAPCRARLLGAWVPSPGSVSTPYPSCSHISEFAGLSTPPSMVYSEDSPEKQNRWDVHGYMGEGV